MNVEALVTTVSAAIGAAAVVGAAVRSYWVRREERQQAAFEQAVQRIVDVSMTGIIKRQIEFEKRQGKHLDRQDETLRRVRLLVEQLQPPAGHRY